MNTIVYLIRHSRKIMPNLINNENNNEHFQNRREKIILSVEGEQRANILSKQKEFEDTDAIYSSNYSRAIETAKYLSEKLNLAINIDNGFNERGLGIADKNHDIYIKQYYDENIKNQEGESRKEVTERMYNSFWNAVNNNQGKKIAIFTHGAAMTFLLMKWCKLEYITDEKRKCLKFKDEVIVDKVFDAPEVFRITIDENKNVIDIKNIEFNDLK